MRKKEQCQKDERKTGPENSRKDRDDTFSCWPAGEYLISFCILLNGRLTTFNLYHAFIRVHWPIK